MQFTWTIESVDLDSKTMIVAYEHAGSVTRLNIHVPPADADVNAWIEQYAPLYEWKRAQVSLADVQPGMTGQGTHVETTIDENPNISGSWSEEYLRAMIYQVLEEVRETQV